MLEIYLSLKEMALISNKTYESKNLTRKGKFIRKIVDQLLREQTQRLKNKSRKIE